MNFSSLEKIAAAILYEGYILYPYRSNSVKNRQRWNFGTLYPRIYAEEQCTEPFRLIAECLLETDRDDPALDLKLQFLLLTPQSDTPESGQHAYSLSNPSLTWEQGIECSAELRLLLLSELGSQPLVRTLRLNTSGAGGSRIDAVLNELQPVLTVKVEKLERGARKLHIELENVTSLASGRAALREEALAMSFVSTHLLLGVDGGQFISLLDPPDAYRQSAQACKNLGVFPVLAGNEPDRSMVLCSPIILYDYPKIAPESEGDFFDSTEMDEMLTLRVLTLSDQEKQQMREGDPRARRILERTEALASEALIKSHGTIREMRELPDGK